MNILYILGNGFDINLGMETRYSDFYKYYASLKSSSIIINKLKNEIETNIDNWSDLELELGKYTQELNTTEEFNEVFEDLEDSLADYLRIIEDKFDFDDLNKNMMYKYLTYPENTLPTADKVELLTYKSKWQNTKWSIRLITFNYTKSLEKLLQYEGKEIEFHPILKNVGHPIVLSKIEHVHGFIDNRMVMGVNDVSQISNKDFHNNQEVIESLVKNDCNQAQKHTIDNRCRSQISNAHLICIFGSSIGDTDKMWWEHIGEQLKKGTRLIIFEKGELISRRRPQKRLPIERRIKRIFLDKTKLNKEEKEAVFNRIFVSINSDMFNLIVD